MPHPPFPTPAYDLTILTLFSGNRAYLESYRQALLSLRKPEKTQLLFIDNSADPLFNQKLKSLSSDTFPFDRQLESGAADNPEKDKQILKALHCSELYNFSKPYIKGKDLLILEHDVIPPAGALENLMKSRLSRRADIISAAIVSRTTGEYLGWRFKKNSIDIDRVFVTRSPKRVMATGFGFLLMKNDVFQAMRITALDPRFSFFGSDIHAGVWAREKDLRWFLDGRVRCGHMNAHDSAARLGHLANTHTGPLYQLQNAGQCPL